MESKGIKKKPFTSHRENMYNIGEVKCKLILSCDDQGKEYEATKRKLELALHTMRNDQGTWRWV